MGSECYVEIRDEHRVGDDAATSWRIDRLYIRLTNTAPVCDTAPITSGLVDSNYILGEYNYITTTVNVSDMNIFTNIDYVTLSVYDNARATNYFTLRFDEDGSTFSEAVNPGNVTLDIGTCTSTKSGTSIDIVFNYTVTFDCPQINNVDYYIEVFDDDDGTDNLWHEANWNTVTSLALDGILDLDDGVGTSDRGGVNGSITAIGTITYSGLSSYHPLAGIIEIQLACVNVSGSPWSSSNYNENDGTFTISAFADDEVGMDTYTLFVDISGVNRLDATYTDSYISDQIICVELNSPSFIVDSSATGHMSTRLQYAFDGTNVTDGNYTLDGVELTYVTNDEWSGSQTPNALTSITYDSITVEANNRHGIDSIDMNGSDLTIYWDQLITYILEPSQSHVFLGENASGIVIWAEYYYASQHPMYTRYTGTLHINDTVFVMSVPGQKGYTVASADGDDLWGVFTIYSRNTTFCIWDIEEDPPSWIEDPANQPSEYSTVFVYDLNASVPSGLVCGG